MPKLSYHLRWNNHLQNIQSLFENLYSEQSLVDVTLSCCDGLLLAHKLVLSACSPYFEQIFKANPCKHPVVILKGIKHYDMQVLLEYMYAGSVDVAEEDLEVLLNIATELQIKGLMQSPEESSDIVNQRLINNKITTQSNSNHKIPTSLSPLPSSGDTLKWQAELVAQPSGLRPNNTDAAYQSRSDGSEGQEITPLFQDAHEKDSGLEVYPCSPVVFDNIKQEPEIEEIMDYYTEEDHIENSNESCEITPTPVDSQPVGTNNSGCFCHVCNREFQNKVAFQRHMLTHSGIKPHQCTYCTQSFLRLSHLQRHIRVHTGERPYSCIKCPKQFSRSDKLRQHYLFQHSDSKLKEMPRNRGRPRKHFDLYTLAQTSQSSNEYHHADTYQPPTDQSDASYPPLSIIPVTGKAK